MWFRWICSLIAATTIPVSDTLGNEPVVVAREWGRQVFKQPQLACGGDGLIHLVYGADESVFHSISKDEGLTFSPGTEAFRCPNLFLGMRRGPRIAVADGSPVVTAIGSSPDGRRDGELQAWHLKSEGAAWSGPTTINTIPSSAREGLHGMAAGPDGSLWCTWLDLRSQKSEIFVARSKDGGVTWGPNSRVYRSPDGSVCECCHPSIAVDANGKVAILFRNSWGGNRDMYLITSPTGELFSPATKLGTGNWKLPACPMDGGMLSTSGGEGITSIWRREKSLFLTTGQMPEKPLGAGEQPWVTSVASGPVAVWISRRDGDLWLLGPKDKSPMKLAALARDPVVVAVPGKNRVVVSWEGRAEGQRAVLALVVDVQ
jgi:hypothetical protein